MTLSENEILSALANLEGWEYAGGKISKTYTLPSYTAGLAFATAVGVIAEGLNHHPDLTILYKKVVVTFTTHDSGNVVTQNDIDAAKKVESLGYPR